MEHRLSHRQPVTCQIDLHYRNQFVSSCRVCDLGRGGSFVEITEVTDIPLGALVRLVWRASPDSLRHVEGLVVHQRSHGVGLMFSDENAASLLSGGQMA